MDVTSVPTEAELDQLLKETSTPSIRRDCIRVKKFLLSERFRDLEERIRDYEVLDTDLWVVGFQKAGGTWISQISWLILNDFDYAGAKADFYSRMRVLEYSILFDTSKEVRFRKEWEVDSVGYSGNQKIPRGIKTHLPFPLLPEQIQNGSKKPRIIYIARNPIDTCIAFYHNCKNLEGYKGTFEQFCKLFLFDRTHYGPYPEHVLSFWQERNRPNILFLTYEELRGDLPGVIDKVGKFLGKKISREDKMKLLQHASFEAIEKKFVDEESRTKMSQQMLAQFKYRMGKQFEGSGLNIFDN